MDGVVVEFLGWVSSAHIDNVDQSKVTVEWVPRLKSGGLEWFFTELRVSLQAGCCNCWFWPV